MAKALHAITQKELFLRPEHVFGRHSEQAHFVLQNGRASRIHASIVWNGDYWQIRDLSSNGTFLNGKRLPKNENTTLSKGDVIDFGGKDIEKLVITDLSAPSPVLVPIEAEGETIEIENLLCLPSEEQPDLTILQAADGSWICEGKEHTFTLKTGDIIGTNDQQWEFIDAATQERTIVAEPIQIDDNEPEFIFRVSQNEEHVSLTINYGSYALDMGERTHHYLLLLLARKRLQDAEHGTESIEQGWYDKDQLCKDLGIAEEHLNIHIYRLRKQINDAHSAENPLKQLIQRRRCEVRLNYDRIQITGGVPA